MTPAARTMLGVSAFTVAVVLVVVALGEVITRASGEGGRPAQTVGGGAATVEAGEAVFWGQGKCSTCHAVGTRGTAIRGPNQGASGPLAMAIGARAEARASERARATGRPYTGTDYLVESLLEPGAHVVEGYKNEMPDPTRPPISLGADDVRAVVLYLQSLGGTVNPAAIRLPARATARAPATDTWRPYLSGDARRGEALFFDAHGNAGCGKCHAVGTRGSAVGPDLSHVAGVRDGPFIVESILEPSKVIASGFEAVLVRTRDERILTGVVKAEDAESLTLADPQGRAQKIAKREVRERVPQRTSLMPENFREILTIEELHDVLAFLLTLK